MIMLYSLESHLLLTIDCKYSAVVQKLLELDAEPSGFGHLAAQVAEAYCTICGNVVLDGFGVCGIQC